MSISTPKQHGIEVVVYRDLMQRFLPAAMKLALHLIDADIAMLNRPARDEA